MNFKTALSSISQKFKNFLPELGLNVNALNKNQANDQSQMIVNYGNNPIFNLPTTNNQQELFRENYEKLIKVLELAKLTGPQPNEQKEQEVYRLMWEVVKQAELELNGEIQEYVKKIQSKINEKLWHNHKRAPVENGGTPFGKERKKLYDDYLTQFQWLDALKPEEIYSKYLK